VSFAVLAEPTRREILDLVDVRADAQRRLYRVRPQPLAEIDEWLAPYRRLWSRSLDRLERHLEDNP
jgi:hypothetical protein